MCNSTINRIDVDAGGTQEITLDVFDDQGVPYDMVLSSVEWRLSKYGETECIMSKTSGSTTLTHEGNKITLTLLGSETENLRGLYRHIVILKDNHNQSYVINYGLINFRPFIK